MILNLWRSIIQYFSDFTLRKKLMISYFLLIFMPLIFLTIASYINVSRGYESKIRYSAEQSFDQAYRFLSYKVNSLIKSSDIIYFDTGVQTVLSRTQKDYENDIVQQNIDMISLDNFLFNFKNSEDVYRVSLYVPGWLMYSNQGINFGNLDSFKETEDYKKLMQSKEKVLWLPPEIIRDNDKFSSSVSVISMLRKIRNTDKIGEIIGIEKVSILESNLKDIIMKANITQNGVVYIQNSQGNIICSSNAELIEKLGLNTDISRRFMELNVNWESVTFGSEKFTVISKNIENTDWTIVTAIPYSEIISEGNKIRNLMAGLALVIGILAYGAAYFISASMVKRISLLTDNMIRVQEGELNVSISAQSQDEIGQLIKSFNYMVKKVNQLVEQQYKTGKEIKNSELKALQAQINPHFLYNTLDLINWKAIDNDVPEIAEVSQALAKFYKLSLSKGKDIISVEEEIKHVETYVKIQNLRFDNRINFIIDVPYELYEYKILKIILQPIVENSILHGILENRDKQEGNIKLSGKLEKDDILLTVEDDGVGMAEEKAIEILTVKSTRESHGYGVRNINKRIKLCYGQEYGLTYYSSIGKGTKVEIRLPALKTESHFL
ncbi:cache domain-containing sensor histidine kinase [Clostridium caldaquaticum]|uniref:cache domain-containing sensor histidine kinase n=1 Tax=Clostridium caldaquaticum TaxID=2940653 RepID=UPI0020776D29|nr:sensor histidine kinase [Clostridium caldaquaticum]